MGDTINITVTGMGEEYRVSILVHDANEPDFKHMFLEPALEVLKAQIMQRIEDRIEAKEVYNLASCNLVDSAKQ